MTKLLNARDLLENVRSADQESSQDTAGGEVVPTAGGRVFLGTFKPRASAAAALGSRSAAVKATAARSAAVRDVAQRSAVARPATAAVPEIALSLPEVAPLEATPPARPQAPAGPPARPVAAAAPAPAAPRAAPAAAPTSSAPSQPAPGWAPVGRKHTVPLEAVRPESAVKPAAAPPSAAQAPLEPSLEKDLADYVRSPAHDPLVESPTIEMALPPELVASAQDFDDGRTLELELPKVGGLPQLGAPIKPPPVAAAEPTAAPRSISPSHPLRKAGTSSWSRSTEAAPGSEPTSPRAPGLARPPVPSTPPSNLPAPEASPSLVVPASAPAPTAPAASAPASAPASPSRPKSAVADMFSWVTQKPAWAPESGALDEAAELDGVDVAVSRAQPAAQPPVAAPAPKPTAVAKPLETRGAPPPSFGVDDAPASIDEPVALSSEETLVMLSYDEATPLRELADSTGLTEWRVSLIVDRLKKRGVLESDAGPHTEPSGSSATANAAAAQAPSSPKAPEPVAQKPAPAASGTPAASAPASSVTTATSAPLTGSVASAPGPNDRAGVEASAESRSPATMPSGAALVELGGLPLAVDAQPLLSAAPAGVESAPASRPAHAPLSASDAATPPPSGAEEHDELDEADEIVEGDEADAPEATEGSKELADPASMLALFELKLSILPVDERAKLAQTTDGDELYALAYDKDPGVLRAAWDNIHISVEHARFWAFHHRTAMGLERIGQRAEFLKDPQTQRRLFRNPQVSEPLLRKILLSKRLIDIYKHTLDREASERTRQSARGLLRNKFSTTEPEDRVQLLWNTEGRALQQLSGLSIDSKTASLVCARPIVSMMLVQSFLRFSATPPSIISYLLKQPLVKRQIHLRNALLKHPNCPADAKRAF